MIFLFIFVQSFLLWHTLGSNAIVTDRYDLMTLYLDPAKTTQIEVISMPLIACITMCQATPPCKVVGYVEASSTCKKYKALAGGSTATEVYLRSGLIVPNTETLILHHDVTSGPVPFYDQNGDFNFNPDDPTNPVHAIGNEVELYRRSDGTFHFKLCYPEILSADECIQWKQTNNPFTDDTHTGFEFISGPDMDFTHVTQFRGLAADSPTVALSDGDLNGYWHGVGVIALYNNQIPGPVLAGADQRIINIVDLYVIT